MRKRWRTRRALERRQEDDARGPLDPTDGAALAGQHATPDRAPVSLARQNSEAVTGVYDEGRAAFEPPFLHRYNLRVANRSGVMLRVY
jgi:hypothetical protein